MWKYQYDQKSFMIVSNPSTATSYGLHAGNMKAGPVSGPRLPLAFADVRPSFLP
jgi:hypothetical protein